MSQFRQFWLDTCDNTFSELSPLGHKDYIIKAIEYTALEAAQKEIERLKTQRAILRCGQCGNEGLFPIGAKYKDEIEQLTAALKVAERALKRYSERTVWFKNGGLLRYKSGATTSFFKGEEWCESDCADEALAEIQKIKKELG